MPGTLRQDAAGFRRDLLPRVFPGRHSLPDQMKRCYQFSAEDRNPVLGMTDDAKTLFRTIDAQNWKLADLLQYVDDRLAAELRQVQRLLAIHCGIILGIWVMKGKFGTVNDYKAHRITKEMVEHAVFLYGLVLASNTIGHPDKTLVRRLTVITSWLGCIDVTALLSCADRSVPQCFP